MTVQANCQSEIHLCFVKFNQKYTADMSTKDIVTVILSVCSTQHTTERKFMLPKAKTKMIQKTVLHRATVRRNSLPVHIGQENTTDRFLLKQYLQTFQ